MDFAPDARSSTSRPDHHRQQLYTVLPQQQYYSSEDNSPTSPSVSPSSWQQQLSNTEQARVAIRQQYHPYQSEQQERQVKRESHQHEMAYNVDEKSASVAGSSSQPPTVPSQPRAAEDSMPSASDFVKKLYKMLEDPSFQSVVCWGPMGDCFVVKDMNEFTKSILPRMFKHSNFASFVRQLNKYDFHKVKNTDDNQFGEHSWTFRHPDFHADRRDALENIKRKVPAQRKYTPSTSAAVTSAAPTSAPYPPPQGSGSSYPYPSSSSSSYPSGPLHTVGGRRSPSPTRAHLTAEIQRLKDEGDDLRGRIRNLERNYENVLVELVSFQRGMAQQDGLMQSLIGWFLEGGKGPLLKASISAPPSQHASLLSSPMDVENQLQVAASSVATPQGGLGQDLQQPQPESHSAKLRQYLQSIQAQQQGSNAGSSSSGLFPTFAPSFLTDPGLFLPPQAVRGQGDIGRATLMQMSELSRRATLAGAGTTGPTTGWGTSGSFPDGVGSPEIPLPQQQQGQGADPTVGPRSRAEHLAQLREYYNQRQGEATAAATATVQSGSGAGWSQQQQGGSNLGRNPGFNESREREMPLSGAAGVTDMNFSGVDDGRGKRQRRSDSGAAFTNRAMQDQQSQQQQSQSTSPSGSWSVLSPSAGLSQYDSSSSQSASLRQALATIPDEVMTHEGLQVYTVGHLLPRNTYIEDAQGNWSFNPSALTASSSSELSNGLGGVAGAPAQGQGQAYGTSEDVDDADEVVRPTPPAGTSLLPAMTSLQSSGSGAKSGASQQKLRVRRSTFVPGWAVPPRVLLVDDDAVSRKLSSKFLKVFGCTTDVAVDGIGAVTKMNLEKYDLVLMDIVMPKLDGVSATNLIRKFDQGTPIISMTSNSKPNEIMTYYSSGMNDILPKPFTKEGLLDMLEKHLMHLKVIQQMSKLSRPVGIPPLSDTNFEQAVRQGASNLLMPPPPPTLTPSSSSSAVTPLSSSPPNASTPNAPSPFGFQFFGDGTDDASDMARVNPLAGMGLSDEQYNVILQNIVNGDGFMGMMDGLDGSGMGTGGSEKRSLEDGEDERGGKRSRFEIVE